MPDSDVYKIENFPSMLFWKKDPRPAKGLWCEGSYTCACIKCGDRYMGDKRSGECADCAYGERITCYWEYEDDTCSFSTNCGDAFYVADGGTLKDHNIKFCPFCGLKITEINLL